MLFCYYPNECIIATNKRDVVADVFWIIIIVDILIFLLSYLMHVRFNLTHSIKDQFYFHMINILKPFLLHITVLLILLIILN